MLMIGKALVSEDVVKKEFVCNLTKCKGECCVAGDLGAPLEDKELKKLEQEFESVSPYLTKEGKEAIAKQGLYVRDEDDDFSTPLVEGGICAYAIKDAQGIVKCGIEEAYNNGDSTFQKPVSCHLYPVRIQQIGEHYGVNYHEWDICSDACSLGKELGVPVYQFVKDGLIRKFGMEWYKELQEAVEHPDSPYKIKIK